MFKEYKFKIELHAHTTPASGCSEISPHQLVQIYKSNGYDSVAITNHFTFSALAKDDGDSYFDRFLEDYYSCLEHGEKVGLNIIFGAEIRFSENSNEYLIYGICPEDMKDIRALLPYGVDNFYREYKNDKNVIIHAHPFRDSASPVNPECIDGIEAFNMHPKHNSRVALAAKYARKNNLIAVCGTDFHHPGQECLSSVLTKEKITDSYQLAKIIKSQDFIMEVGGYKLLPDAN